MTSQAAGCSENRAYFQSDFAPAEFASRRDRLASEIGSGTVALLRGGPSTGAFDIFRQTNEFYYLSGVETPHAYLRIDGGSGRTALYLPASDPHQAASEGRELNATDADEGIAITGVQAVRPLEALMPDLAGTNRVWTPFSPGEARMQCRDTLRHGEKQRRADPWADPSGSEERFRARIAEALPGTEIHDLSPLLDRMRLLKSPAELAVMRRAGQLTALAVLEAMRSTRPGVMEFQLGAAADYIFLVNGAKGGGYRPIIGGGGNIWNGHYYRNNQPLREGELVLMDYAPDLGCYTSDIGRTWPVNGRYNPWQRELYGYIVEYHKVYLEILRPGRTREELRVEAAERMRPVVDSTRWSKPSFEAAARRTLEFKGHLSHPVGMAVHDVGTYNDGPLHPGLVFALDPQMWIPEERLYIRVEDTVAITNGGVENLTAVAPLELDDVEAVVGTGGLLQTHPPVPPIS